MSPEKLTEEEVKTAIILGWCVEWVSLKWKKKKEKSSLFCFL